MASEKSTTALLPHLFREEYTKMTAVLCRHFGLQHIAVAEDIASETFLKAAEIWPLKGIPANPTAWLYTVAQNHTKDYLKRNTLFESRIKEALSQPVATNPADIDFTAQTITDSQLAMIFAVCNPANAPETQICLALQILCGFSVQEIADAFLAKPETIKKRLLRGRATLRTENLPLTPLPQNLITARQDTVLRTLYLLFNEGYGSHTTPLNIQQDLCADAMRLTLLLTQHPATLTAQARALLALMCFQSSRLAARTTPTGLAIPFDAQDRQQWDQALIDHGNHYLVAACEGLQVSKYHLEAAIAYWHTTPTNTDKWKHILTLYDQLIQIEYSPMTALNRVFALAQVYGSDAAIPEAEKIAWSEHSAYHALLGYLHTASSPTQAITHYQAAHHYARSAQEKASLQKKIDQLKQ